MLTGPLEIGLIIVIVLIFLALTRTKRSGRRTSETSQRDTANQDGKATSRFKVRHHQILGTVLIIVAAVFLWIAASMFKWVFWSYLWAFAVLAVGLIAIFMWPKR